MTALAKGGLRGVLKEARVQGGEDFKSRKKRQRKPKIKNAIVARRLERPEGMKEKSVTALLKTVQ